MVGSNEGWSPAAVAHVSALRQQLSDAEKTVADLKDALRGMLEHCTCQGRGYRSWEDGRILKHCQSTTCRYARQVLGLPSPPDQRFPTIESAGDT
jgi:hypothetical protein